MELKDFVEQKKTEKAEEARQEKERQIAEAEKGLREEEERREKEDALHQHEEFEKLEEIRKKISSLEQEKKDVLDSLAGWKTGQAEVKSAAKTAKEKRGEIKEVFEKGKEFFAEKGVEGVKGLLKSEEFAEAGEIKSYKEAEMVLLEKAQELKKHKKGVTGKEKKFGHLTKAEKESAKKLEKINHEIQELREQTPEGQRELKETAKKEILARHDKLNHLVLYDYNGLRSTNFVEKKDLELIPKVGEGLVKDTILKYYLRQLEDGLSRKSGDVLALKKELEALKKLPEKMEEANSALRKLERRREEAERVMRENMENAGAIITGSPLDEERAQKSVRAYVDNYLANFVVERRRNTREEIVDIDYLLDEKWQYSDQLINIFRNFDKNPQVLQGGTKGGGFVFSFPNPDYVKETAEVFNKFLETVIEVLKQKPNITLEGVKDPKLEPFYKPEKIIEARKNLTLKQVTYDALRYGLSSLQEARGKIHFFEQRLEGAGEAVKAKFEKDWNQAKLQELDRDKKAYEVTQKKKDIDIWKERAKEVLSQLPELRLKLKEKLDEKITVLQWGNLRNKSIEEDFVVTCRDIQKEASEIEDRAKELEKEEGPLKEKIRLKKANEPRWWKKEKYMAELEDLEQQQHDFEQKIEKYKTEARELYHLATSIARDVAKVLELSGTVNWDVVNQREFTVKELLSLAEKKAKEDSETRLSPSEEVVYKKRKDLEEAIERASQKISKIYPNY